jgi:hypothetical protein
MSLLLALAAGPAGASPSGPAAAAQAAPVAVSVTMRADTDAAWAKLRALGWKLVSVEQVMGQGPNGTKVCFAAYRGTLPRAAIAAARKLPEVGGVHEARPTP